MNCSEVRELFSARADDLLMPEQSAALDRHLDTCVECPREWERFRQTLTALHSLEEAQAPAGFARRVVETAWREPWHRGVLRRVFLPLHVKLPLEAVALVLVSTLVILLFRQTPEMQRAIEAPAPATEFLESAPPPASKMAEFKKQRRALDVVGEKARPKEDEEAAAAPTESVGGRLEIAREALKSAAQPPEARQAARARSPLHVVGRLRAKESEALDRQLKDLLKQVGAAVRRDVMAHDAESREVGRTLIVVVPRADFPRLASGLSQLGNFIIETEPGVLPDPVHVTIRITE